MSTENEQFNSESSKTENGFEWVPSPNGLFEMYCNYTQTSWTLYDIRVSLGQIKPLRTESRKFVAEERAAITISWPQAKQLMISLAQLVHSYEQTNGEIKPLRLTPDPTTSSTGSIEP